jgi:hypothetical protein
MFEPRADAPNAQRPSPSATRCDRGRQFPSQVTSFVVRATRFCRFKQWVTHMQTSAYFRQLSDRCSKMARGCFDLSTQGELRTLADEFKSKAEAEESRFHLISALFKLNGP